MPGNVNDKTPWTEIITKTSKVFFFIGFCDISRYTSDVFGGIFVQGVTVLSDTDAATDLQDGFRGDAV